MPTDRSRPILLWGPMGVGKTTVGRRVAELLGRPFIDLDHEVERAAGSTIPAIFEHDGEARFRSLEAELLTGILDASTSAVVALGGGTLVSFGLRKLALQRGLVVSLRASASVLAGRLDGGARPLLSGVGGADLVARLADIGRARGAAYTEAHFWVDAERDPESVANEVVGALTDEHLTVDFEGVAGAVRLAKAPFEALAATLAAWRPSSTLVAFDPTVEELHGKALDVALSERGLASPERVFLPEGEPRKTFSSLEGILGRLAALEADRSTVLVVVGGGVATDLGGFAAAIYQRGIRWIAIPTTLLGIADAAMGGKTAVDFAGAKNLVGCFHPPALVIATPALASTEAPARTRSGIAEVVKSLALGDAEGFIAFEQAAQSTGFALSATHPAVVEAIHAAIRVKAALVSRDPRDRGERALLNYGHTFGHALEASAGFDQWFHGEAVSVGMVVANHLGCLLEVTPGDVAERVCALLARLGLPITASRANVAAALPLLALDKKREGELIRFVMLRGLGDAVCRLVPLSDLVRAIDGWSA